MEDGGPCSYVWLFSYFHILTHYSMCQPPCIIILSMLLGLIFLPFHSSCLSNSLLLPAFCSLQIWKHQFSWKHIKTNCGMSPASKTFPPSPTGWLFTVLYAKLVLTHHWTAVLCRTHVYIFGFLLFHLDTSSQVPITPSKPADCRLISLQMGRAILSQRFQRSLLISWHYAHHRML